MISIEISLTTVLGTKRWKGNNTWQAKTNKALIFLNYFYSKLIVTSLLLHLKVSILYEQIVVN